MPPAAQKLREAGGEGLALSLPRFCLAPRPRISCLKDQPEEVLQV